MEPIDINQRKQKHAAMVTGEGWSRILELAAELDCFKEKRGQTMPDPGVLLDRLSEAIANPERKAQLMALLADDFEKLRLAEPLIEKPPSRRGTHPNTIAALTYHKGRTPKYGEKQSDRVVTVTPEAWGETLKLAADLDCLKTRNGEPAPNPSDFYQKLGLVMGQPKVRDRLIKLLREGIAKTPSRREDSGTVGRPLVYGQPTVGQEFTTTTGAWEGFLDLTVELNCLKVRKGETQPNPSEFAQKLGLAVQQPKTKELLIKLLHPVFQQIEMFDRVG